MLTIGSAFQVRFMLADRPDLRTGIEAYVFGSGRGPEWVLDNDPRLYELVRQCVPSSRMPGNVYVWRVRGR